MLIDPTAHRAYTQARDQLCKMACFESIAAVDYMLFHGRSIIFNRATPRHIDSNDVPEGWAVLLALGDFDGGELYLPNLGIAIPFPPGALIFIRGGILPHEILAFRGGQRISIAHFVHESVFRHVGVKISL